MISGFTRSGGRVVEAIRNEVGRPWEKMVSGGNKSTQGGVSQGRLRFLVCKQIELHV